MSANDSFFQEIYIADIGELRQFFRKMGSDWFCRGQSDTSWVLKTSLERAVDGDGSEKNTLKSQPHHYLERNFDFEFRRRAHHYLSETDLHDPICRLSLMQHYRVSTRLLDFTRSPYIAAYFSLWQRAEEKDCAIWAINKWWLRSVEQELLKSELTKRENQKKHRELHPVSSPREYETSIARDAEWVPYLPSVLADYCNMDMREKRHRVLHGFFKDVYANAESRGHKQRRGVIRLIPPKLDKRIMAQQGLFLAPLNINVGFMENLRKSLVIVKPNEGRLPPIIKYVIPKRIQITLARDLTMMNVTGFALMPDIEGLAEWMDFTKKVTLDTKTKQKRGLEEISNNGEDNGGSESSGGSTVATHSKCYDRYPQEERIGAIERSDFRLELSIPNRAGTLFEVLRVLSELRLNLEYYYLVDMHKDIHRVAMDCKAPEMSLTKSPRSREIVFNRGAQESQGGDDQQIALVNAEAFARICRRLSDTDWEVTKEGKPGWFADDKEREAISLALCKPCADHELLKSALIAAMAFHARDRLMDVTCGSKRERKPCGDNPCKSLTEDGKCPELAGCGEETRDKPKMALVQPRHREIAFPEIQRGARQSKS